MTQAKNVAINGSYINSSGVLQVAGGGTGATTQAGAANAVLPSQTSQTGKYLTTDGTNASWGTVTSNPGTVTSITAGTGLSGGTITSSGTIAVANTAVTAGSYTNASVTVNAQGQLTAASSGTAPVTSVGAGTGISSTGGTTPTITNTGVTSVAAGSGISVSGSTGAVTISASGGGTVSSVATGNGLSGGTITTSGTLVIACPTALSIGSYTYGEIYYWTGSSITSGSNWSAGSGTNQVQYLVEPHGNQVNSLSGSWKWMGPSVNFSNYCTAPFGLFCRVA